VSFYTGQGIAASLRTLADYAQHIRRTGDLSEPLPEVSRDEVGELASAFDDMRVRLYEQTTRLADVNATLERKSEEMEQFVYTVSHDLSSPLVSCKGLIGLIKEDLADGDYEQVRALTDKLDDATDQLRQIIDDLLALSRMGRRQPNLTRVDVQTLLAGLQQDLADRLEAAGARLQIDAGIPPVIADASHTQRVFENLLTNAIKYGCRADGAVIRIGGTAVDGEICYFVRDNGPGIDPAYHQKIFGLFQRLDSTKQGTGVGLASVVKIMNMHRGRVWVQSEPGQGATFWISFPRRPDTSAAPRRHTPPSPKEITP
jgi:signal transduction histidine kinase